MNGEHRDGIYLTAVYADGHVIELEAIVIAGDWRGRASVYAAPTDIVQFAKGLEDFAEGANKQVEFVPGKDNGAGLLAFRFYRIDRAGHIAVHARLATGKHESNCRPEEIRRLSVEVATETSDVIEFLRQLRQLAQVQSGGATLRIDPEGARIVA